MAIVTAAATGREATATDAKMKITAPTAHSPVLSAKSTAPARMEPMAHAPATQDGPAETAASALLAITAPPAWPARPACMAAATMAAAGTAAVRVTMDTWAISVMPLSAQAEAGEGQEGTLVNLSEQQ